MRIFYLIPVSICMMGLLLLQSCGPKGDGCEEHEPVNSYYNISDAEKSRIPFTGTDTLVYISSNGDTAILYGQGKKAFTDKVAVKWDPDPGCGTYDYNNIENVEFTFIGNHHDLNRIFIDLNAGIYSPDEAKADIVIGSILYRTYLQALNHPSNYIDSITIGGITYFGIKIYGEMNMPYLYNREYGLLQITTSGKTWLKKI